MIDYLISTSFVYLLIKFIVYYMFFTNSMRITLFFYKNFLRKRKNLIQRYGSQSWVLVTGATDGIGRALCEEFAKEGFNIILLSRNQNKLSEVSKFLQSKFKINTLNIEFDFTQKYSIEEYKQLEKLFENYDISILVNNVGTNIRGYMKEVSLENYKDIINVNIVPQTFLTKIFSEYLSKRSKRSAVIDLSSVSSTIPTPYRAIYTATKSFNYLLSRALADEFENMNIDFLCVQPLFVGTPLTRMRPDGYKVISAEQCANGILNDLGYEKLTNGHWVHKIQAFLFRILPEFAKDYLMNNVYMNLFKKKTNKN